MYSFYSLRFKTIIILFIGTALSVTLSAQVPHKVFDWLAKQNCSVTTSIQQYDHSQYNLLTNRKTIALNGDTSEITFLDSRWKPKIEAAFLKGQPDAIDFTVNFTCVSGYLKQGSLSVTLNISKWHEQNYVLFPAAAYNGNRYPWRRLRYSPKLYEVQDIGPDKPIILTDVPKLSESGGVSRIQERAGSLSSPCVGFQSSTDSSGVLIRFQQGNQLGDYGVGIAESRDRSGASISLTSPIVRELFMYRSNDAHAPSMDIPGDFKAGDEVTFAFRIYGFKAPDVPSLFEKFAAVRKDFPVKDTLKNTLPFSACFQLLEEKFNAKNFVQQYGYYSVGLRENFLQDWQIGWTGGMISTYPLLVSGNPQTIVNVRRNFDWLFPNGISPSGFYWDAGKDGTIWYGGDIRKPHTGNWHLIRKSGDAVFYILKQFMLMKNSGQIVKPSWEEGNQKVCDALSALWLKNHQLGQFVNSQTGAIEVGGSSSGAIVPAALVLAAKYYKNKKYFEVAQEIGLHYYENFTLKGITCGGPGDALQNFDSESAYALVESFTSLYEATQDKKWLIAAEQAAKQFASWVVSYNFKFPKESLFNKIGIQSTGAVYANTQNKHASPGICTYSGIALLNLYRYTGNTMYVDLLYDIAHQMPQYLPHPAKPVGDAKFGYVSERVNLTDWEGKENIGSLFALSTWAETSLMLTATEIPGIYVQPEKNYFVGFDNVEVKKIEESKSKLVLKVTNTTPVKAIVSVFEDHEVAAATPVNTINRTTITKLEIEPLQFKILSFSKRKKGK